MAFLMLITGTWPIQAISLYNSKTVKDVIFFKPQIILHVFEGHGRESRFLKSMVLIYVRAQAGFHSHSTYSLELET